jgi:predicted P-loop ATPase
LESYLSEYFSFRFNEINGNIEFKNHDGKNWEELNEFNIYRKLKLQDIKAGFNDLIFLLKSDFVEKYNPIAEYFGSLNPWKEGDEDNIQKLCGYVKTKQPQRFEKHFKKWLVRAIKCAVEDDYCNKNAIILVGEKQNTGKTSIIRFLVPPALKDYTTENISFDKDSLIALIENIVINLDELATFTKVEINALKSILSKSFIKERHPFERKAKKLPRRASFIGSTNQSEFLTDPTGNVRWLPFEITGIDWNYSKEINIDTIWAQAYTLYKSSFPCDITAEEVKENEEANKQFTMVTVEMELLMKYYQPGTKEEHDVFKTTGEVEIILREKTNNLIKISNAQLGRAFKILGYERDNRYDKDKGYAIKAYYLKFSEEN